MFSALTHFISHHSGSTNNANNTVGNSRSADIKNRSQKTALFPDYGTHPADADKPRAASTELTKISETDTGSGKDRSTLTPKDIDRGSVPKKPVKPDPHSQSVFFPNKDKPHE